MRADPLLGDPCTPEGLVGEDRARHRRNAGTEARGARAGTAVVDGGDAAREHRVMVQGSDDPYVRVARLQGGQAPPPALTSARTPSARLTSVIIRTTASGSCTGMLPNP